jgi:hypothetical protein
MSNYLLKKERGHARVCGIRKDHGRFRSRLTMPSHGRAFFAPFSWRGKGEMRTSAMITWFEDPGSGRGYAVLRADDGGRAEKEWGEPITAATDSCSVADLFTCDGFILEDIEHDGDTIHVTIVH